jgi:hypothetical protein
LSHPTTLPCQPPESAAASIIVLAGAVCFSAGVLAPSVPLGPLAMIVGALIGIIGLLQWLRSYWPASSGMT